MTAASGLLRRRRLAKTNSLVRFCGYAASQLIYQLPITPHTMVVIRLLASSAYNSPSHPFKFRSGQIVYPLSKQHRKRQDYPALTHGHGQTLPSSRRSLGTELSIYYRCGCKQRFSHLELFRIFSVTIQESLHDLTCPTV